MAVFIELTTDAFEETFRGQSVGSRYRTSRAGRQMVRRPHRGLEVKDDTYAFFKVIRSDGIEIPLFDSSRTKFSSETGYSNFILQQVQESRMEKHKIIETFGETYIFFFGEQPRFLDVQAVLINSHDFNWEAEWWENYDTYLRGTKLVEMGARAYLFYDDNVVEGYPLMAQAVKSSREPHLVTLTFKFFVTNYRNISFIGNENFPVRTSVVLPEGVELTRGDAGAEIITHLRGDAFTRQQSATLNQFLTDPDSRQAITDSSGAPGPFGQFKKISDTFRAAARTFDVAPDVFLALNDNPEALIQAVKTVSRLGNPIRSKISDNIDEYTGWDYGLTNPLIQMGDGQFGLLAPSALAPIIRNQLEVSDLFREAIQYLSCFGADINNPETINNLGLGPVFGKSATASASASFGPKPGGGFGFSAKAEASAEVGFGDFDQFQSDPLSNVFGPSNAFAGASASASAGAAAGAGGAFASAGASASYGFNSDFGGVGFGKAGFGDFGGTGFGSGYGVEGDPGFKDQSRFTFAGVAAERAAFDRFLAPGEDPTSLGGGFTATASAQAGAFAGVSRSGAFAGAGASAGASFGNSAVTSVEGRPSAFAMVSAEGTLDSSGKARSSSSAISGRQQQQSLGKQVDNPFGVQCADTVTNSSTGVSNSVGKSVSFP